MWKWGVRGRRVEWRRSSLPFCFSAPACPSGDEGAVRFRDGTSERSHSACFRQMAKNVQLSVAWQDCEMGTIVRPQVGCRCCSRAFLGAASRKPECRGGAGHEFLSERPQGASFNSWPRNRTQASAAARRDRATFCVPFLVGQKGDTPRVERATPASVDVSSEPVSRLHSGRR